MALPMKFRMQKKRMANGTRQINLFNTRGGSLRNHAIVDRHLGLLTGFLLMHRLFDPRIRHTDTPLEN